VEEKNVSEDIVWFDSDSFPYGLSYGQWTVRWWNWFLLTPKSINPIIDPSGEFASVNQPPQDVWFLSGKIADENEYMPTRFCRIPSERSILFPIINCEANPLEYPELKSEQALIDKVTADENTIIEKVCFLDGKSIPAQRVKSDPFIFELSITDDNVINLPKGGKTIAHGDGYWVFLKKISPGEHLISFRGSCENGRLRSGASYNITVQ